MSRLPKLDRFNAEVKSKYEVLNGIFMTLPFDTITNTGVFLPLFQEICEKGYANSKNPTEIIEQFFEKYLKGLELKERHSLLFRFIQYIERQVVLFDAIEDASYRIVHNMDGRGTLRNIKEEAVALGKTEELIDYLNTFKIRPVLTAHPTQFYPGVVLGIINDLSKAIINNNIQLIKQLLSQLGKTPFFKKEKPSPYDEAVSLIWYLEHVFYKSVGYIYNYIQQNLLGDRVFSNQLIDLGFWPGGDRDGNPFVTTEITLKVARRLRSTIIKNYYDDIRKLRRRITFAGTQEPLKILSEQLFNAISIKGKLPFTIENILDKLLQLKEIVIKKHQGLFVDQIDDIINKVKIFKLHFATLDIRQDSSIHQYVFEHLITHAKSKNEFIFPKEYLKLPEADQILYLNTVEGRLDPKAFEDETVQKTLGSIYAMKTIQEENGEYGANATII